MASSITSFSTRVVALPQVLAGLPADQRAALLAAQAEGAMALDEVDEVRD